MREVKRPARMGQLERGRTYRYECNTPSGGKFWEVTVTRHTHFQTSWGRLGSVGQTKAKQVPQANHDAWKLIEEKERKGYAFVYSMGTGTPAASQPKPKVKAKPKAKPKAYFVDPHPTQFPDDDTIQASFSIDLE